MGLLGPFDSRVGFELVVDPGEFGEINSISARILPKYVGGGRVYISGTYGGNPIGYLVDDPDVGFGGYLETISFEAGVPVEISFEIYLRGDIDIASINAEAIYDSLFVNDEIGYIRGRDISEFFGYRANDTITGHIYIE